MTPAREGSFTSGIFANNPAWVQLLGLCPLLAVSSSAVNALGLSLASALVLIGSNVCISAVRQAVPAFARLPCFVLIIATFTTTAVLLMEAFAFDLYLRIALFVQIIVTNCMILGRAESFASRNGIAATLRDASGIAVGFAVALLALGIVRELIATGAVFANMALLFGPSAATWQISLVAENAGLMLAALPPGAFLVAGCLLAAANSIRARLRSRARDAG